MAYEYSNMMMMNRPCRRWLTTNQDEYRNPVSVKIDNRIQSDEFARYEDCMAQKECEEEQLRQFAKDTLCCTEQRVNRELVNYPTDSHINEELKCTKPSWCRCLATGDPNCFEEEREEKCTDDMCYCKQVYNQMEPTPDNKRQKIYSSTYYIDYRDPKFPYIKNQLGIKKILDDKFKAYKEKADAEDAKKEPKIIPPPPVEPNRVDPNCMGLYESLPEEKVHKVWKPDESWWRDETDDCRKEMIKKYIWTSTYREMNKDGAALPLAVKVLPESCIESPPGDPVKRKAEMAPKALFNLGEVFEKWDRPQVRTIAQRCDTMYNRPCLEYDSYFKDHYLHRAKFARCPEIHALPTEENLRLAREDKLRMPYDRMIPGYMGYDMEEAPPVCKIKTVFDPNDPYDELSTYQADFTPHPQEIYEHPVQPYKPSDFDRMGIPTNPIHTLGNMKLPEARRLSCYLECNRKSLPPGYMPVSYNNQGC